MKDTKKMTLTALILMIFTSVFGFNNIPRAFFLMGYSAIPWYLFGALCYFVPYAFMMAEYGAAFKEEKGIYAWMERSVGAKFAFVGTFMWFSSYIVWMVSVSSSIWVPLSNLIFGTDKTSTWNLFGLGAAKTLGMLGVLFIVVVTYLSSKGIKGISKIASVGGFFVSSANVVLLFGSVIVFLKNGFMAREYISLPAFFNSPNPSYTSILAIFSFLVYAIFAYGGLEAVGGLVDETENSEKNFPKGINISALVIGIGYSLGILMVGLSTNWQEVLNSTDVGMANVSYVVIKNLGIEFGSVFGFSEAVCGTIGVWFARYIGLAMFLALIGAFFTLVYSPLKQLIEGTPKQIWSEKLVKLNENGMPANAMWLQCSIVIAMIVISSFGGVAATAFLDYLILMANVAMTVPIVFLAISFIFFKKNDDIYKPFVIFKSKGIAYLSAAIVIFTVSFANIFTIIQPVLEDGDYVATVFQLAGPVFFSVIALLLFSRYEKKNNLVN